MARPTNDSARNLTYDDVVALVGELDDRTIVDILETNPTYADIEQALLALGRTDDPIIRPLSASAEAVRDILLADPAFASGEDADK